MIKKIMNGGKTICDFGMPALVEFYSLEDNIELCHRLNLDFIELNLDIPYCFLENLDTKLLNNNNFTIHLSEKFDVGELNSSLRELYLNEIEKIIFFGTKFNIFKYNLHLDPGIHFSLPNKKIFIYQEYLSDYLKAYKSSCDILSNIANKYNATILFENVKIESYTLKAIEIISNYDNLFFTLDLGHNIKHGNVAKEQFLKFENKIRHIHLHDFDGSKDHQELFSGILNVKEELNFCSKNNLDVVIEVKRQEELVNSVNKLKRHGYIAK